MLSEMSSHQLSEWMAFYSLEPFGFERDIYGHGIVAATIVNVRRKKRFVKPQDFIPKEKELSSVGSFFKNLKAMILLRGRNNGDNGS